MKLKSKYILTNFIIKYTIGYKKKLCLIYLIILISTIVTYLSPWILRFVIDSVIPAKNLSLLHLVFLGLLSISILKNYGNLLKKKLILTTGEYIVRTIKFNLLDKLRKTDYKILTKYHSGYLFNRIFNEIDTLDSLVTTYVFNIFLNIISFFVGGSVLLYFSPLLFGVIVIFAPLFFLPYLLFGKKISEKQKIIWNENAILEAKYLDYIKFLPHYNMIRNKQYFNTKIENSYNKVLKDFISLEKLRYLMDFLTSFFQGLLPQIVFWIGFSMVIKDTISLGTIIAIQVYISYFLSPLSFFFDNALSVKIYRKKIERIEEIFNFDSYSEPKLAKNIKIDKISLKNICFKYDEENILRDCNFSFNIGDFLGITGRSGLGKSTLAKMIAGLLTPNEGVILVNDREISKIDLQENLFYCPQKTVFFEGSIYENITFKDREDIAESEINQIKELAKLASVYFDLDRDITEGADNFSGGERQKISILRALYSKRKFVIFDEAFSQIDKKDRIKIVKNLRNYAAENTLSVLIISQITDIFTENEIKSIKFEDLNRE